MLADRECLRSLPTSNQALCQNDWPAKAECGYSGRGKSAVIHCIHQANAETMKQRLLAKARRCVRTNLLFLLYYGGLDRHTGFLSAAGEVSELPTINSLANGGFSSKENTYPPEA